MTTSTGRAWLVRPVAAVGGAQILASDRRGERGNVRGRHLDVDARLEQTEDHVGTDDEDPVQSPFDNQNWTVTIDSREHSLRDTGLGPEVALGRTVVVRSVNEDGRPRDERGDEAAAQEPRNRRPGCDRTATREVAHHEHQTHAQRGEGDERDAVRPAIEVNARRLAALGNVAAVDDPCGEEHQRDERESTHRRRTQPSSRPAHRAHRRSPTPEQRSGSPGS